MKLGKFLFALVIFFLAVGSARSQQEAKEDYFAKEKEPKSHSSVEVWYSYYYFDQAKIFEEFFDKTYLDPVGITVGWYPVRNLDLQVRAGYAQRQGTTIGIKSGLPSEEDVTLTVIPVQAELLYRFDFFHEQFLVPSAGAGYDWWYFKEDNEFSDDVEGDKTGWNATAGLAVLLDRVDPSGKLPLEQDFGIENVFLNFEARWTSLTDKDGFDFSGIGYSASLLFEF